MTLISLIAFAMVSIGAFIAFGVRQRLWPLQTSRFEVGRVSEGWLAEQSGRRQY